MSYKIIALIGEAGSGKDTMLKELLKRNPKSNEIISFTTRPPREKEKDGVNYYFIDGESFGQKVLDGQMLEASCFNGWFYGTGFESLRSNCVNIGVFNPEGIDSMIALGRDKIELYVYYLETTPKNRLLRQLNREENPDVDEIVRRYKADLMDFEDLDFHYNAIPNNDTRELKQGVRIISAAVRALEAKINQSN